MPERHGFAVRLKMLRTEAGLTQPALADRAGISVSAVRQFEYGLREPAFGTLVKLAEALGVSLDAFKDGGAAADSTEAPPVDPKPRRRRRPDNS